MHRVFAIRRKWDTKILSQQLKEEKAVSHLVIKKAICKAEQMMGNAHYLVSEYRMKEIQLEEVMVDEEKSWRAKVSVCKAEK